MVRLVAKTNSLTIVIVLYLQMFTSPFHRYYQHCTECQTILNQPARGKSQNNGTTQSKVKVSSETIIVSDSDVQNQTKATYCDKVSELMFNNRSMECVDYYECPTIGSEPSEKVRRLTCGLKLDGSIRVCCISFTLDSPGDIARPVSLDYVEPAEGRSPIPEKSEETIVVTDDETPVTHRSTNNRSDRSHDIEKLKSASEFEIKFPKKCGLVVKDDHDTEEPKSATDEVRIINGQNAKRNAWPWFALIMVQRRTSGQKSPECGGTLISDRFVLTAAHCVLEQNRRTIRRSRLTIRLGESDLKRAGDGEVDVDVERIIAHPNFQPNTFKNDIALIELKHKVSA